MYLYCHLPWNIYMFPEYAYGEVIQYKTFSLSFNIHISVTYLKQKRLACFIHSITGYCLLKLIMSVYIIKKLTNYKQYSKQV